MSLEVYAQGKKMHGDDNPPVTLTTGVSEYNPAKIGGVTMTANPSKLAGGKVSDIRTDAIGRPLMVPYQVRELVSTGFATLTRLSEGTVISGVASTFLDVKEISCINTTGQAIRVDFRFGTAGSIVDSLVVPANDTRVKQYNVPLPMSEVAQALTAQVATPTGDISDNFAVVSAVAVQNL